MHTECDIDIVGFEENPSCNNASHLLVRQPVKIALKPLFTSEISVDIISISIENVC